MADRAGDAGLAGRVVHVVEVRVVELAGEERHGVVAAGAPAGGLGGAVALQRDLAGLAHAHQVGLVVERAEVVRRVEPAVVRVLVALQAVPVHHQRLGRDELAVGRDRLGREEVLLALPRPLDAERPGVLEVEHPHDGDEAEDREREPAGPFPADPRAGQPVLDVEGHRRERGDDVEPVADVADPRVADLEPADPDQDEAGDHGDQPRGQEDQAVADGRPCWAASTRLPGARSRRARNGMTRKSPRNRCRATMIM